MAPSEGSEGGSKRKRSAALSPHCSEKEALEWIRMDVLGGKGSLVAVFDKLVAKLQHDGQGLDGNFWWITDEVQLKGLGCSISAAHRIARAVAAVKAAAVATQELAPTTQQLAAAGQQQQEEQPQEQQQLQANGGRRVQRELARRPPATQLEPSLLANGHQETQEAAGEQQEQQQDGQEEQEEEEGQQGSEERPPQVQQVRIKPDPEQLEAEAAAWKAQLAQQTQQAQQQSQQQGSQRRSQRRHSARQLAAEGGSAMETDGTAEEGEEGSQEQQDGQDEDFEEEHEEEEADEEEEEEEEEHVLAGSRRRRSVRVKKEEPQELPTGAAAAATQQAQQTQQQSQRQRTPQPEQAGPSGAGAAAAAAGGSGRMLTRRQRQQQEDAVLAATRRQARAATMAERQRREEQDEARRMEEEESEDEQALQEGQAAASDDEEDENPLVHEDLGPEAPQAQYRHDWQRRCRWGLQEIFGSMSVDELRELIEAEEEGGWPDLVLKCLQQKKKVDGVTVWADHTKSKPIANKLTNFLLTGTLDGKREEGGAGGMRRQDIGDLLKRRCDEGVRMYVQHVLRKRYQNLPCSSDPHKLMWKLWRFPDGPAEGEPEIILGSRVLRCEQIRGIEPGEDNTVPFRMITSAIQHGGIVLQDQDENLTLWIQHLTDLTGHPKFKVLARVYREPGNLALKFTLYQLFTADSLSASLVSGTWKKQNPDGMGGEPEESIVAVDVAFLMSCLDEVQGTPFAQQMDELLIAFEDTTNEVAAKGVETELALESPISFKQFDKCMTCVEDLDRPEPADFKQECDDAFLLTLRPYQRRSLAHMLHEERAAGGSARHLWVQYNLPQNPEIYCYVSPILHQIRCSTSKIEMEQWIGTKGGAGWIALQMGMGKTACAVGAIQMNPPPEGWRANRAYQSLRLRDHLSSIENNMPHGGTLIVMPPTLIDQWEDEIRKTTQVELSILKWTENTKGAPRTLDCKEIAQYDIVLSTFPLATQLHTLSHIRWWRIIADEPQLQAGGFLADKEHRWFANHKWLLTGTPINATVESISPSMQFLGMGQFDMLFHHYPPVITHVLKRYMVRYTKCGSVDGEPNLILPPLTERVIECTLSDDDATYYHQLKTEQRLAYRNILEKLHINPDLLGDGDPAYDNYKRPKLNSKMIKLRGMVTTLRKAAASALKQDTGVELYDEEKDKYIKEKWWYKSKAEAVIEILENRDEDEKVIVFSEYPDCLRQIKKLLPDIGLQSRDLIGGGSAAARGKAIRAFQTDPPTRVFLITHRAGGAGVTLTAGTHIILCEPTLNPSFARQAIGRSHRMGQEHPVTVTRLLMKSTIEEKIAAFAARWETEGDEDEEMAAALDEEDGEAMRLASTALEANAAANDETSKLTIEDLRDMINNVDDDDL